MAKNFKIGVNGVRFNGPAQMEIICDAGDLGAKPDFPTFIDGHIAILVNEAILKSAKENRWIDVYYAD